MAFLSMSATSSYLIKSSGDATKTVVSYMSAHPVPNVELVEALEEPYPWDNNTGKIVDCNAERNSERVALACNIYHEARNQSRRGQIAVGLVTRNRVESSRYPNTYSGVVWDIRRSNKTKKKVAQFSWALDGKHDRVYEKKSWRQAWFIAKDIIAGKYEDFTNGALWYHTKSVNPVWSKKLQKVAIVDDHIFYVKNNQ